MQVMVMNVIIWRGSSDKFRKFQKYIFVRCILQLIDGLELQFPVLLFLVLDFMKSFLGSIPYELITFVDSSKLIVIFFFISNFSIFHYRVVSGEVTPSNGSGPTVAQGFRKSFISPKILFEFECHN